MDENYWTADGSPGWSADGANEWSADGFYLNAILVPDEQWLIALIERCFSIAYVPAAIAAACVRNFSVAYIPGVAIEPPAPTRGISWMKTP